MLAAAASGSGSKRVRLCFCKLQVAGGGKGEYGLVAYTVRCLCDRAGMFYLITVPRLATVAPYPAMIIDVKRSLAFLRVSHIGG